MGISLEVLVNGLLEGVMPVVNLFLAPIFLWIVVPGLITMALFKSRQAYALGSIVGLFLLFSIGPFSN